MTSVDLPGIIAHNPSFAHTLVGALLVADSEQGLDTYLDVLKRLPPTLPSFDLMGRLLMDTTLVTDVITGGRTTIADLVRTEVLGWFIHECVSWLDRAEQDEREGNISDDRFAKGVQNVRIYPAPPFCGTHRPACYSFAGFSPRSSSSGSSILPRTQIQQRWHTSRCVMHVSKKPMRSTAALRMAEDSSIHRVPRHDGPLSSFESRYRDHDHLLTYLCLRPHLLGARTGFGTRDWDFGGKGAGCLLWRISACA